MLIKSVWLLNLSEQNSLWKKILESIKKITIQHEITKVIGQFLNLCVKFFLRLEFLVEGVLKIKITNYNLNIKRMLRSSKLEQLLAYRNIFTHCFW